MGLVTTISENLGKVITSDKTVSESRIILYDTDEHKKILTTPCRNTSEAELKLLRVKDRIIIAMRYAWIGGYGLAAVQIGIPIRYAWAMLPQKKDGPNKELELINPKIIRQDRRQMHIKEGCLSIPAKCIDTVRYGFIEIENNGRIETYENVDAFIIQHEIDHMDGILLTDREYKREQSRNEPCACGSGKKYKKCHGQ